MWSKMPTYNFKREAELYIVHGGVQYRLDVSPDISFSQTFKNTSYPQKTLHQQFAFNEVSTFKQANPANFEFTISTLSENDLDVVMDLLLKYKTGTYNLNSFDLYIKTNTHIYKIENCVIQTGAFLIERLRELRLTVSGEGSKLSRVSSLPLSTQARSSTRTYQQLSYLTVKFGGTTLPHVRSVSIELENGTSWLKNDTVHRGLAVTNTATSIYPTDFVLENRTISGSISQYITDGEYINVQTWKEGTRLQIHAGPDASTGFDFDFTSVSYTNRINASGVFTQNYDWRMVSNASSDLSTLITHT